MRKFIYISLLVVAGLVGLSFTPPAERYFEIARNLDIFATLFREVNALYVDEVNPNTLVKTGIDAMLESLDPYTTYIPEDMVEDYRTLNTGQYGGIGAVTNQIGNRTVVTMLMQGFAAQKGGLKIGDEILKIDQVELSKVTPEEAGKLMKGQLGTPVSLTIKRPGTADPIKLSFKREKIKVNNVPYFGMVSPSVGYVQLTDFTPDAGKEVRDAILLLKDDGAEGIILDLRGNPGGLLMEAVNICNIFLDKGQLVVSTRGKIPEHNMNYETLNDATDASIPVTVLIDRGSASASEIVAGTLQDYDRAVIVGEKSYGKGLVQMSRPLSYNAQLRVTTAKYYTPTGRCIQVLDYSHRRNDGSVSSIPDSLKSDFKTTHGRVVFDGGGIDPDIQTEPNDEHPAIAALIDKGFIFDYATKYVLEQGKSVPDPKKFSLSNSDYQQFVNWMSGKDYTYTSKLELSLKNLYAEAKKERYYNELKGSLDQINTRVSDSRKNELLLYKDQIKQLLEEEIIARYHLERGRVESRFKYDQDVKTAIEILGNQQEYVKTLNTK